MLTRSKGVTALEHEEHHKSSAGRRFPLPLLAFESYREPLLHVSRPLQAPSQGRIVDKVTSDASIGVESEAEFGELPDSGTASPDVDLSFWEV